MTHEELRSLLAAYALDALSPQEAGAVDAHLRSCAACRQELAALREAATALAVGVAQVPPPAELRRRVLASVRQEGRPAVSAWTWGLAAAAAVLVVALAAAAVSVSRELAALQQRLAAQQQLLALLAAPTAKTATLRGTVDASARLIYDPVRAQGALVVVNLRDPGPASVYQLWLIAGQTPEGAGVFRPVPGEPVILPVRADFGRIQAVAISVERAPSGAPRPTTTPILVGELGG